MDRTTYSNTVFITIGQLQSHCFAGQTCKEVTCLHALAWYKQNHGVETLVFTNDSKTISFVLRLGLMVAPIRRTNRYGIPIFKYLLLDAQRLSKTKLYTYANADILINANLLAAAEAYQQFNPSNRVVI